jgi:hypothetical protein
MCLGAAAVLGIALIASGGDDPTPNANGSTTGATDTTAATSADTSVNATTDVTTDVTTDATESSVQAGPGSSSASGPSTAVTTIRPAVVVTTSPGVIAATNPNPSATLKPATGTVASTTQPPGAPGTTLPSLRLFFLKVSTGSCDGNHQFSWTVDLLSTLTPAADPVPDRIVQNPSNPRGWDVFWTATYDGPFTSPLTVISAGGESFTVPAGEAAQPTNCP